VGIPQGLFPIRPCAPTKWAVAWGADRVRGTCSVTMSQPPMWYGSDCPKRRPHATVNASSFQEVQHHQGRWIKQCSWRRREGASTTSGGGPKRRRCTSWYKNISIPWVLSFPIPLRFLFAAHPELLAPVLQIIHRVIATFLIQQAGLKRTEADTGAVTLHPALRIGRQFEHPSTLPRARWGLSHHRGRPGVPPRARPRKC